MTSRKRQPKDDLDRAILELVTVLPPIVAGSVVVVRTDVKSYDAGTRILDGLKAHYGHDDFLVVVLGLHETIDVIPAHEIESWADSRRGYFGRVGRRGEDL